jgi:site-specific recombinase XerD
MCYGRNTAATARLLRYGYASHLLDRGAPINLVSATLGHAALRTRSVYTHTRPTGRSAR